MVDVDRLGPKSAKSEVDGLTESGWIWVAVGLAVIHKEVAVIVNLGQDHRVCDWGLKVESLGNFRFNERYLVQEWHELSINRETFKLFST